MSCNASWKAEKSVAMVADLAAIADLVRAAASDEVKNHLHGALYDGLKLMAVSLAEEKEISPDGWNPNDAKLIMDGGVAAYEAIVARYRAGDDNGYRATMQRDATDNAERLARRSLN